MRFDAWPRSAAWTLQDVQDGFEVCFFEERPAGTLIRGYTATVEDGVAWAARYEVEIDEAWRTRRARIWGASSTEEQSITLDADGDGSWFVDGVRVPMLDGCLDVDLEASACTNTLPVHRFGLPIDGASDAPAAYVRRDLTILRLEQRYRRITDDPDHGPRFDYDSPGFDFRCVLTYDSSGLVVDYPGIARRHL